MNYLISPILYEGSCFNDIIYGLIESARQNRVKLNHLHLSHKKLKSQGLENPDEYFHDSISKLSYLAQHLKSGDKVIFADFFCPGLDLINYYLIRKNISVKKIALLHGASFIDGDIYQEFKWLKNFEKGWLAIYDLVISPSQFFLKNLSETDRDKFKIYPWGLDKAIKPSFNEKIYDIIFPHRLSDDKGIEDFIKLIKRMPDLSFCMTGLDKNVARGNNKKIRKYLKELEKLKNLTIIGIENPRNHLLRLKKSKIVFSASLQEGFGFAVMKSVQCGNIPVLPNRCCYPEYFPTKYLYNSLDEASKKIRAFLSTYPKSYYKLNLSKFDYLNIINHLKG